MTARVLTPLRRLNRPTIQEFSYRCRACRSPWALYAFRKPASVRCPFCGGVGAIRGR